MKLTRLYFKSKENGIAISLFSIFLFAYSFFTDNIFVKIIFYIFFVIAISYDFYFVCKLLILRNKIKRDQTIFKTIQIKYIKNIASIGGYRQNFAKSYYGIKIVSNKKTYLYFYKNILNEKSNFNTYQKVSRLKKVRIEVYKNTNVIKKIFGNI